MTPEDFEAKMRELYPPDKEIEVEREHEEADKLMCELLVSLGYGQGVEIFRAARKWYS